MKTFDWLISREVDAMKMSQKWAFMKKTYLGLLLKVTQPRNVHVETKLLVTC